MKVPYRLVELRVELTWSEAIVWATFRYDADTDVSVRKVFDTSPVAHSAIALAKAWQKPFARPRWETDGVRYYARLHALHESGAVIEA